MVEAEHGGVVFGLVSPHGGGPVLKGEEAATELDLNHVSQFSPLLYYLGYPVLQRHHLLGRPPVEALFGP